MGRMKRTCVVVADRKRARFFSLEPEDDRHASPFLMERPGIINIDFGSARKYGQENTQCVTNPQAGREHPVDASCPPHRLERERRFGRDIARLASKMANTANIDTIVFIA